MVKKAVDFIVAYGEFPVFGDMPADHPDFKSTYAAALNWCSAAFNPEELKAIFIGYLEDGDEPTSHLDLVPAHKFIVLGKIAYIRKQGALVSEETVNFYNTNLANVRMLAKQLAEEKVEKEAIKSFVRPVQYDICYVGEVLEDFIDADRLLITSDGYELLLRYKSKQGFLKALKERFVAAQDEYSKARTTYKEYFETVSDSSIAYRLRCYARILEDIESVIHNKKAIRKKIVRRASAERKVKNVTYRQVDDELKVQSLDPTAILGAYMLLLYNTKKNRISVLVASSEAGLSVKGTTVQGFDPNKSVSKTLRRPQQQVLEFRRADRTRRIEVLINQIRGKNFEVSGRLGADTLILKVLSK